jgi:MFS family permease
MPADRVVAVSGRLILMSGLGSVLGPLIGTRIMASFDIDGLFYFMAATAFALAVLGSIGGRRVTPPVRQERPFTILTPQASPLGHDPRSPEDEHSPAPVGAAPTAC